MRDVQYEPRVRRDATEACAKNEVRGICVKGMILYSSDHHSPGLILEPMQRHVSGLIEGQ
jgi:hypothetical protein